MRSSGAWDPSPHRCADVEERQKERTNCELLGFWHAGGAIGSTGVRASPAARRKPQGSRAAKEVGAQAAHLRQRPAGSRQASHRGQGLARSRRATGRRQEQARDRRAGSAAAPQRSQAAREAPRAQNLGCGEGAQAPQQVVRASASSGREAACTIIYDINSGGCPATSTAATSSCAGPGAGAPPPDVPHHRTASPSTST